MENTQKNDYFDQFIRYKALRFKFLDGDKLLENVLNDPNQEEINSQFKNVCAKLPLKMVDDLEGVCGLLDMSKRRFIEMAVSQALERCNKIFDDVDAFEFCTPVENQQKESA